MDPREHWQAVYGAKRPEEVSWYQAMPEPSLAALDRLGVTPDKAIVDVGAGASRLADALLGSRFRGRNPGRYCRDRWKAACGWGFGQARFTGKWRMSGIGIQR